MSGGELPDLVSIASDSERSQLYSTADFDYELHPHWKSGAFITQLPGADDEMAHEVMVMRGSDALQP